MVYGINNRTGESEKIEARSGINPATQAEAPGHEG